MSDNMILSKHIQGLGSFIQDNLHLLTIPISFGWSSTRYISGAHIINKVRKQKDHFQRKVLCSCIYVRQKGLVWEIVTETGVAPGCTCIPCVIYQPVMARHRHCSSRPSYDPTTIPLPNQIFQTLSTRLVWNAWIFHFPFSNCTHQFRADSLLINKSFLLLN